MADDTSPVVSGISPREGPPGTKITIRGENLGESKDDVIALTIRDVDCLKSLEYISSKKLVCYSPDIIGKSQIIVSTLSGGEGFCLVHFTGLEADIEPALDILEESDVWVDEAYNPRAPGVSTLQEAPVYLKLSDDPLGSADPLSKRRPSKANLEKLFPDCSGDLLANNFNPRWYLAERHRNTSFAALKRGLVHLEREVEKSQEAPMQFMRENLMTFLQAYDTLSDVNELLIRNESEYVGGSLTDKIEEQLKDAAQHAEEVFDGVIKCKVRADQTRNALTVLQRYRFLFNLPRSIDKNISNGDYDLVTTDYERAKSLFADTQVKSFKKVMDEVEHQIRTFRHDMRKKLQILPTTLEEQKKIIKYLLELDCDGDPAWECITNVHQWILKLLFTSKENHQNPRSNLNSRELVALPPSLVIEQDIPPELPPRRGTVVVSAEESLPDRSHNRTLSDTSHSSGQSLGSHSTAAPPVVPRSHQRNPSGSTRFDSSGRPVKIVFVESMTDIMLQRFPDLWRLGKAYFSESLFFQGATNLKEKQQQLIRNCGNNKSRFESMILEIIEVYTDMVNCTLFGDAYEQLNQKKKDRLGQWLPFDDPFMENSGEWLPQTVRKIRECVSSLQGLSLPEKAVGITTQLAFNVRTLCANTLFQRAARDIKVLHEREDWHVQAEVGGVITSLPILFENIVVEVLISLKEIIVDNRSEVMDYLNEELLENSKRHFHALLEHFSSCFDYLAFHQEDEVGQSITMISPEQSAPSTTDELEGAAPTSDERLLTILSNLRYLMKEVLPRLFHCFVGHGYPPAEDVREAITEQLLELDDKVFSEYIQHKSENMTGIIEEGMKAGHFDWDHCPPATQVRSYIKEVLFNLVLIHAEVHAVSANIVQRVMCCLVELLSSEFLKQLRDVDNFSFNGIVHAYVELSSLEEMMEVHLTDTSISTFELCRRHLAEWDVQAADNVHAVVDAFKEKTKLQLRCFRMNLVEPEEEEDQAEETVEKEDTEVPARAKIGSFSTGTTGSISTGTTGSFSAGTTGSFSTGATGSFSTGTTGSGLSKESLSSKTMYINLSPAKGSSSRESFSKTKKSDDFGFKKVASKPKMEEPSDNEFRRVTSRIKPLPEGF